MEGGKESYRKLVGMYGESYYGLRFFCGWEIGVGNVWFVYYGWGYFVGGFYLGVLLVEVFLRI